MTPDPLAALLSSPPDLPVASVLGEIRAALRERGVVVVHAPPGTGKTTLVPPLVACAMEQIGSGGRVIVTQPRRIAARAAARRLAQLLGQSVGESAGWSVRGESRVSAATRVEFVTTGVLLRRLQRDPELAGTSAVILDEVHERAVDADLLQAMLHDVRSTLRPDLAVVAMSATLESERLRALWANEDGHAASEVTSPGGLFAVEEVWCPPIRPIAALSERGMTREWADHLAACVRRAVSERTGDVLVFVPGVGEVDDLVRRLGMMRDSSGTVDVLRLHGRLPSDEQDRALSPSARRRVIISTAVAESSITVPGVRVVVDGGLAREPRTDHARGLAGLVTVLVSRDGATQRAGRAGREGPGSVYRPWTQGDHARLAPHRLPEIATADLADFVLAAGCWTNQGVAGLALLDDPPATALESAEVTLRALGAIDGAGVVTARGRLIAEIPAHPRLARALIDGAPLVGKQRASEVVALLSEDIRVGDADLTATLRALARGGGGAPGGQWRRAVDQFSSALKRLALREPERSVLAARGLDAAAADVVALAYPDRIARLRPGGSSYLLASGTGAVLPPGSPLRGAPWLAIADADRGPGRRDALIRAAVPLDEASASAAAPALLADHDVVEFDGGRLRARRIRSLGAIELTSRPIADPPADQVVAALRQALEREGLGLLSWSESAVALRTRLAFLHEHLGQGWPAVDDSALLDHLGEWLMGRRINRLSDLRQLDLVSALRQLVPWPQASQLDALAPERVDLPSGRSARVDYSGAAPAVSVKIQDAFGLRATPLIADGRVAVVMHLLSPAGRPAAITADMASFWESGYSAVRADLRGRYPKHAWPEKP